MEPTNTKWLERKRAATRHFFFSGVSAVRNDKDHGERCTQGCALYIICDWNDQRRAVFVFHEYVCM